MIEVATAKIAKMGHSFCITLPRRVREQMGLSHGDVLGLRVIFVQKRILLVGEKVGMQHIARLDELPLDVLAGGKSRG